MAKKIAAKDEPYAYEVVAPDVQGLEHSPAYEVLLKNNLVSSQYRLHNIEDIQCVPANTSHKKNNIRFALSCLCPIFGPIAFKLITKTFEVPHGCIRLAQDGRGGFFFFGPGLHFIKDPYIRVADENTFLGQGTIQNGNQTIVVVDQGYVGYAMDKGQPVLLPPGMHQWTSDTLNFQRTVDLNNNYIKLGPYTLLTVDEGYSAVTQNNGKQVILPGGAVHLLTHRNWKFEKFMSEKIQTHSLERFEATSADNVLLIVIATVNWRIHDVEVAARMAAETMRADGSESGSAGDDIKKLRNDVLRQAEASLASFIGTVNYSDSFHVSATAQSGMSIANPAVVAKPSESTTVINRPEGEHHGSSIFDVKMIKTAVQDANEVTAQYGVHITSINIISAKPADPKLMTSLARGAVAAAEAQQAETAARGNAAAAQLEAEGQAAAAVINARGRATAEKIIAEGAREAADILGGSELAGELARIDKMGKVLGERTSFFFGAQPEHLGSLLSNPNVVAARDRGSAGQV